ncbi:helix-turn-helix transcriptional regulator [Rothia halotolerans]|uniref:helix-turn-helix transcriptional regulator n=1 Tax=Rothia halotolerans TaxID=405770 RepID=UPI00101D2A1E|nr:WYL domain-containing protein [Rothia halotolerans]
MPAKVPERLLALYSLLVARERPLSRAQIREGIEAYRELGSAAAFERTFERDKAALRQLGLEILVEHRRGEPVYSLDRYGLWLPEVRFDAGERLVLGMASRLWEDPRYGEEMDRAVWRLGLPADAEAPRARIAVPGLDPGGSGFEAVLAALPRGEELSFGYRAGDSLTRRPRRLRPWGLGQRFNHWYVSGWDPERGAPRTLRLSRMSGIESRPSDAPGPPPGFSMSRALEDLTDSGGARVRLRCAPELLPVVADWLEAGIGLRRADAAAGSPGRGDDDTQAPLRQEGDLLLRAEVTDLEECCRCLAEAPGKVVLESEDLDPETLRAVERRVAELEETAARLTRLLAAGPATEPGEADAEAPRTRRRESNPRRFLRLLDIIAYLGSRPGTTVGELAERFGTTRRQIGRDIDAVAAAGDYLIGSGDLRVESLDGELYVHLTQHLDRPLRLPPEQVLRLLLAMRLLAEVAPELDPTIAAVAEKLARVAPEDSLDAEQVSIRVESRTSDVVDRLRAAMEDGHRVRIAYRSRGRASATPRRVEPRDLYTTNGSWRLRALSLEHGEERTYRIEAIERVEEDDCGEDAVPGSAGAAPAERTLVWVSRSAPRIAEQLDGAVMRPMRLAEAPGPGIDREGDVVDIELRDPAGLRRFMLHHAGLVAPLDEPEWWARAQEASPAVSRNALTAIEGKTEQEEK